MTETSTLWQGKLVLQLVSGWRFSPVGWLPQVLGVLEGEPRVVPKHFLVDGRTAAASFKRHPFDRATLLRRVENSLLTPSGSKAFSAARRTVELKYTLEVREWHRSSHLAMVFDADVHRSEADLELICSVADRLAAAMRVDVGILYPIGFAPFERPNDPNLRIVFRGGLDEVGLTRLGIRSYLGTRVAELIGVEAIKSSEWFGATLDRGVTRLDLADRPFLLDRLALEEASARATSAFEASGVFPTVKRVGRGAHSTLVPVAPGPRWVPLPGVRGRLERERVGAPHELTSLAECSSIALREGPWRLHLVSPTTFSEDWLHAVCELVEQLGPEQFSVGGRFTKYDRELLVDATSKALQTDRARTVTLRRTHEYRPFTLHIGFLFGLQTHLVLTLPAVATDAWFDLLLVADQLAVAVSADLGGLGRVPDLEGDRIEILGEPFVESLAFHGPSKVGIRTWASERVRGLLDLQTIAQGGVIAERIGSGLTRIDLDRGLTTVNDEKLEARRTALESSLRAQQLLAEPGADRRLVAGARWVPLPGVAEFVSRLIGLNASIIASASDAPAESPPRTNPVELDP